MSTNAPPTLEPETPLDPDEPYTPTWFTLLGLGLFLLGGIFLLACPGGEEEASVTRPAEAKEAPSENDADGEPPEAAADPHAGHNHD